MVLSRTREKVDSLTFFLKHNLFIYFLLFLKTSFIYLFFFGEDKDFFQRLKYMLK